MPFNKETKPIAIIITRILQMGWGASSPVERNIKSKVGPVSRSVFSHIKISSHHIHRLGRGK